MKRVVFEGDDFVYTVTVGPTTIVLEMKDFEVKGKRISFDTKATLSTEGMVLDES